jgi:hypothetical protein
VVPAPLYIKGFQIHSKVVARAKQVFGYLSQRVSEKKSGIDNAPGARPARFPLFIEAYVVRGGPITLPPHGNSRPTSASSGKQVPGAAPRSCCSSRRSAAGNKSRLDEGSTICRSYPGLN